MQTVLRDLTVRQCTLNAGAKHVREVTAVGGDHRRVDGRDLRLESGDMSTVLRWEKTPEILCLLIEGLELRNALRAEPREALTPEGDGLSALRAIIAGAPGHLKAGGRLLVEHGADQGAACRRGKDIPAPDSERPAAADHEDRHAERADGPSQVILDRKGAS